MKPIPWFVLFGVITLAFAACGGPVQAVRVDPKVVHGDLAQSAVTTGDPSLPTRNVLFELGLFDRFAERPEAALADLHKAMVASGGEPDLLFALAELSFLHGDSAKKREYLMAAAVYADAFLFPEGTGAAPGRFDPRVRIAADLYNWALTTGFASEDRSEVALRGGRQSQRHRRGAAHSPTARRPEVKPAVHRPFQGGDSTMRKTTVLLTVLGFSMAFLMAARGTAPAQSDTSGKISLESKSVAVGVGVSWGDGILEYQGKKYSFTVEGLSVLDLGVAKVSARGEVKNLKKLDDFNGTYALLGAGAGAGGGAGTALLKNQNGVEMALTAMGQGVKLSAAQGGVGVKLKK